MNRIRIAADRPAYAPHVNDWWTDHLERYLTKREFQFKRIEPIADYMPAVFDVEIRNPDEDFRIRVIAQRYGQSTIGIHSEDGLAWVPMFS